MHRWITSGIGHSCWLLLPLIAPYARLACQRAIEAVLYGYYVDEERFLKEGGALVGQWLTSVRKNNLSEVPLAVFGREEFDWLSAVIFSSCASWGKVRALSSDPNPNIFFEAVRLNAGGVMPHVMRAPKSAYAESLLDGLRVYHNPSATNKLDVNLFRHPDVFQVISHKRMGSGCMIRGMACFFTAVLSPPFRAPAPKTRELRIQEQASRGEDSCFKEDSSS
jgi:hypothetical protein